MKLKDIDVIQRGASATIQALDHLSTLNACRPGLRRLVQTTTLSRGTSRNCRPTTFLGPIPPRGVDQVNAKIQLPAG